MDFTSTQDFYIMSFIEFTICAIVFILMRISYKIIRLVIESYTSCKKSSNVKKKISSYKWTLLSHEVVRVKNGKIIPSSHRDLSNNLNNDDVIIMNKHESSTKETTLIKDENKKVLSLANSSDRKKVFIKERTYNFKTLVNYFNEIIAKNQRMEMRLNVINQIKAQNLRKAYQKNNKTGHI
ncbi:hypothetical protein HERIO_2533 [Hepatospora eriocheir]|uniref:Uncharacterized protein n=1 Tax=Hepatospora eriocheir TaxID=1081669 RepID=A0A1X0Q6P4_9MICR|nr:hypothetical protein HERIO_2533 [Hepatospora eriocheir]